MATMLACATCAIGARADVETVRTKDGSIYRGELVEKVVGHHVAVKIATGAIRVIAWHDIDDSAAPAAPEQSEAETETVRTWDGDVYRGEVVERVIGDHVTLRIVTGATRVIDWHAIDDGPPGPPSPRSGAIVETVRLKNGNVFRGEVIERIVDRHVVLKLMTGEIRRIDWDDIGMPPPPKHPRPRTKHMEELVAVTFDANDDGALLEWFDPSLSTFVAVCRRQCSESALPAGTYRVAGAGLRPTQSFSLERGQANHVRADMAHGSMRATGAVLLGVSVPILVSGALFLVDAASNPYSDNGGITWLGGATEVFGLAMVAVGIIALVSSGSSVTLDQPTVALHEPHVRVGLDGLHF